MEDDPEDGDIVNAQPRFITHHLQEIKEPLGEKQRKEVEELWNSVDGCIDQTDKSTVHDKGVAERVVFNRPIGTDESKVALLGKHVCRLIPDGWLYDEAINMYMWLLQCRSNKRTIMANSNGKGAKPSHYFNSYFIQKLIQLEGKRGSVKEKAMDRWADKVTSVKGNVFLLDNVMVSRNINDQYTPFLSHQPV
jgi:Ulp1 family protease